MHEFVQIISYQEFVPNESVPRKDSYDKIRMFRISTAAIGVGDTVLLVSYRNRIAYCIQYSQSQTRINSDLVPMQRVGKSALFSEQVHTCGSHCDCSNKVAVTKTCPDSNCSGRIFYSRQSVFNTVYSVRCLSCLRVKGSFQEAALIIFPSTPIKNTEDGMKRWLRRAKKRRSIGCPLDLFVLSGISRFVLRIIKKSANRLSDAVPTNEDSIQLYELRNKFIKYGLYGSFHKYPFYN
ncbi:hypothetical protein NQ317_009242 [Molorchus minor]|uniref:Uncharacterized protein n=1 Tax=Molorchus minor TaxID=1323400 RepID=A0ABQ9IX42_9CUCU|nr:hypothetical protein NQ317_009242 [Molorchus minor]